MNRFHKKVWFISILLTVNILMLVSCKSNNIDEANVELEIQGKEVTH